MSGTSRPNLQILEEAALWFARFRDTELAQASHREFSEWLKRSPEHIRAYLEIASVYVDLPEPQELRTPTERIDRARSNAELNVILIDRDRRVSPNANRQVRATQPQALMTLSQRRGLRAMVLAAVLSCVLVGGWLYTERNTYRTGIGEQRSLILSDGSIVDLNALSKVRVSLHEAQRDIYLLEGQALFRVAKDRARPFVVHAGEANIRAVGTQFDVYRKAFGATVSVLEGQVLVSPPQVANAADDGTVSDQTEPTAAEQLPKRETSRIRIAAAEERAIMLAAGEQATVTQTQAEKTANPNVAAATAWTRHQLVFDATPLNEALQEFSRYTAQRIVLDSPELGELQISGQYTSASLGSLLRFLSLQKGVVVTTVDGEIHIRKE